MRNKIKSGIIGILNLALNIYFIFLVSLFITDYSFIINGGISNFSIQAFIFLFLLFIRRLAEKETFGNISFIKIMNKLLKTGDWNILVFIFLVFAVIFSTIGIARHLAFSSSGCDLAATDLAIWNTARGRIMFSSLIGNISHFGGHFEPVLFLITPLYLLWPNVIILILLQAIALGAAIFPLYLIARLRLKSRFLIFAFIIAYFFSRPIRGVGFLDFHTDSFLVPLSLFFYYFLVSKKTKFALLAMFSMLLCKENTAFLIAGFGIFTFFSLKNRALGVAIFITAVFTWILETNILMPFFSHTKEFPYLSLLPFGKTYWENITAVINNPALLISLIFGPGKIEFYLKLFGPLGFLAFLSPANYILFLVPLSTQIIGSAGHPGMQTISSHYPAHTIPFIFIASIYGAGWLIDKFGKSDKANKRISFFIALYLIIFSLAFYGKSDGHKLSKFIQGTKDMRSKEALLALKTIPADASVTTVNRLVPHLSHRKYIYMWENSPDTRYLTEYVVLHRRLIETDKERFDQIIVELKERGFKEVYADKYNDLFIFFNPIYKKELLENRQGKLLF